uniref:Uncharacterized protein n=1 Tax=Anopheles atroparvus TaxID=41427 RepID=A0AAG5DMU9_ANOAO
SGRDQAFLRRHTQICGIFFSQDFLTKKHVPESFRSVVNHDKKQAKLPQTNVVGAFTGRSWQSTIFRDDTNGAAPAGLIRRRFRAPAGTRTHLRAPCKQIILKRESSGG